MQTTKQKRQSNRLIPRIDAIGFASVMLVLLFIMMLPFITMNPHQFPTRDVDLAKVRHPIPMPGANREDALIIVITRDGLVWIGRDKLMLSEIPVKISEMVKNGSPKVVYLKVDARAKYRYVSDVLDAVRSSGLERIAFLTSELKTNH